MGIWLYWASRLVQRLSWEQIERLGRTLGRWAYRCATRKRTALIYNLKQAHPNQEILELAPKIFEHYGSYYLELLKINADQKDWFIKHLEIEGKPYFDEANALGKGVIVVTPHMGNWDLAGCGLTSLTPNVAAVVEVLQPPSLFRWFVRTRQSLGMQIIGLDAHAGKACLKHLKNKGTLALVSDRDILGTGLPLPFMGQIASIPKGPAQLALRSGAALIVGYCVRSGAGQFKGKFFPPLKLKKSNDFEDDVFFNTRAMAAQLELAIRAHIDQWCMLQEIQHGKR